MRASLLMSVGLGFCFAVSSVAFASDPRIELVQSVPVETGLGVDGIRRTQEVWLDMINRAQSSIDLEEFYVDAKAGQALDPVLAALWSAAARGVKIRLIVDAKFYKTYHADPDKLATSPNVELHVIDFGPGIQHSKFFVVDRSEVYEGSANYDWLALEHIHEIGLHVADSTVAERLEAVFDVDWGAAPPVASPLSGGDWTLDGAPPFFVVASPAARNPQGIPASLDAMIKVMDRAQSTLRVQVYQYSLKPVKGAGRWTALDDALRRAARRGVHVELLVDNVALKGAAEALGDLARQPGIEVRAVTIPEWSGGHLDYARLIHSKYFTIDGEAAWVGSENWSEGYFTNSRDVGLLLHLPAIAAQLEQVFDRVWTSPYARALPLP